MLTSSQHSLLLTEQNVFNCDIQPWRTAEFYQAIKETTVYILNQYYSLFSSLCTCKLSQMYWNFIGCYLRMQTHRTLCFLHSIFPTPRMQISLFDVVAVVQKTLQQQGDWLLRLIIKEWESLLCATSVYKQQNKFLCRNYLSWQAHWRVMLWLLKGKEACARTRS